MLLRSPAAEAELSMAMGAIKARRELKRMLKVEVTEGGRMGRKMALGGMRDWRRKGVRLRLERLDEDEERRDSHLTGTSSFLYFAALATILTFGPPSPEPRRPFTLSGLVVGEVSSRTGRPRGCLCSPRTQGEARLGGRATVEG